jgi:hypothetical protein
MSDTLEVKIGASDAGLEATLKTVQAELANMEAKVKSGDLSFNELEKTMRRMGQVEGLEKKLKEMGDEAAGAAPKVDNLSKELEGVGAKASGLGGFFDESFAKMAGAVSVGNIAAAGFNKAVDLAFTGAQAVVQGFGDALDLGGRLSELSARTGESAGKLLVLETAFKNAGLGAETVGTSINKLQNFMQDAANGGDKQVDTMKRLGISMAELQGKTPTEQMQIFADKIAAIDDPTQRAATASDVFGDKLGGKLLPLLTDFSPALDDAREKVGSMEQVMDENAATFDTAGETIDTVKGKMTTFAAGVLSEVIPAVRGLGEEMSKVDFASFGEKVGEVLVGKIEKFKDATTGASELVKFLNNALGSAVNSAIPVDDAFTKITDTTVDLYEGFEKARTYTSVLGIAWDLLTSKGAEIRASQDSAAEGIANTGDAAGEASGKIGEVGNKTDEATGKIGELGTQAESTGESIASSFSLNGEFAPQLDSVAASWGNINEQVTGNQELLSSNLSLGESMVGKTEEQTQSLGFLNEQHSLQEQLAKTIDYTYGEHAKKLEDNAAKQDKIAEKEAMRKAQAQETLQFELQLAEAKATGNKQEIEDLTKKKEWLDESHRLRHGRGAGGSVCQQPRRREDQRRQHQAASIYHRQGRRAGHGKRARRLQVLPRGHGQDRKVQGRRRGETRRQSRARRDRGIRQIHECRFAKYGFCRHSRKTRRPRSLAHWPRADQSHHEFCRRVERQARRQPNRLGKSKADMARNTRLHYRRKNHYSA